MADAAIIDDVVVLAARPESSTLQLHERRAAEDRFEVIVIEADAEALANQAGGCTVQRTPRRVKPPEEVTVTTVRS